MCVCNPLTPQEQYVVEIEEKAKEAQEFLDYFSIVNDTFGPIAKSAEEEEKRKREIDTNNQLDSKETTE